jgi:hypothetical protein
LAFYTTPGTPPTNRAAERHGQSAAYLEVLGRSFTFALRARTLGDAMRFRSGLGEVLSVTLWHSRALDPLELYDWMDKDYRPLTDAWTQVWAVGTQQAIDAADAVMTACRELMTAATDRPGRGRIAQAYRALIGEVWTKEQLAAYDSALTKLAEERVALLKVLRREMGADVVELALERAERQARERASEDDKVTQAGSPPDPCSEGDQTIAIAEPPGDRTDQAALMGAAIAAIITLVLGSGPWELLSSVIGVSLIAILVGFYRPQWRGTSRREVVDSLTQGLALAAVGALCVCLSIAYFVQTHFLADRVYSNCQQVAEAAKLSQDAEPVEPFATQIEDNAFGDCLGRETTARFPQMWLGAFLLLLTAYVVTYSVMRLHSGGTRSRQGRSKRLTRPPPSALIL